MNTHDHHPAEDELVLLFYGDTTPEDERRLSQHVDRCATCGPVWQEITTTLRAVDAAGVPEPPADFERVMWARVQRGIEDVPAPTRWLTRSLWVPAVSLAAVVLAVTTTLLIRSGDSSAPGVPATDVNGVTASTQPERALLVAMDEHLERSELLLVELMNADRAGFERAIADDLLLSGRLYRQTAAHTGNFELASMLEDLERVLVEIARGPMDLTTTDLDALRARIVEDDLIFKVRVVTDEIRRRQQAMTTESEGEL